MNVKRVLGPYKVSAIGLGCMPLSGFPPEKAWILEKRDEAIKVIHTALDAGITLLDTSDIYAPTWNTMGHNEKLVGEALGTWSGSAAQKSEVVMATKGGITRAPGDNWFGVSGRNSNEHYFYRAAEASALRLGVEKIKLWQHHRLDHHMSFEEQFENVLKLKNYGIVENVGLCNVTAEQIELAVKIGGTPEQGGLISVQNQWSPRYRHDHDVITKCEKYGIAFLPWSPMGGIANSAAVGSGMYTAFDELAKEKAVSTYAITIAWHLANSPVSIPIPGATRAESILDSCRGVSVELTPAELQRLNDSLPQDLGPVHEEMLDHPPLRRK
ncbi:MAG: aldo/keto reductase [Actinobacteria bacterium]|nr:aldo/keto reductase [Actinomycetota bacterium]